MVDLQPYLDVHLESIVRRFADEKEKYLLEIFGSYEKAKEIAHLYVLEEEDFVFDQEGDVVRISYNYRVRPKTPEELEADAATKHAPPVGTQPRDLNDIHEWTWQGSGFHQYLECMCGYRPQNQEDMDEHIPPA